MEDEKLIHKEEVYQLVGCAMEVLNAIGHGLHEKPYENALVVEFGLKELSCEQQKRFSVTYKSVMVGEYIPDLIVGRAVIVDSKVIDRITLLERGQMLNYLRITDLKIGLILNFKRPKLELERIIL